MAISTPTNMNVTQMQAAQSNNLALYIHWPFCVSKCPYCDFNSHVRDKIDMTSWRHALLADMAHEAALLPDRTLTSIFFGGGTPSLMPPELVSDIIAQAALHWRFSDDIEITLEANPSSVEAARFADLAQAGVNRVSLGMQSFDDAELSFLGRAHSAKEGLAALDTAQTHFGRVTFDLIYALPEQSLEDWQAMLAKALAFGTGHLSLYQLTIEPNTRFASDVRRNVFAPMDDERAADFYLATAQQTQAAGLNAYEISNYAASQQQSRHNLTYWRYGDYAGIGPGAHGRRGGMATERHKKPENYLSAIERNQHGMKVENLLTPIEAAQEAVLMGLRLMEGIDLHALEQRFKLARENIIDMESLAILTSQNICTFNGNILNINDESRLLLDGILAQILRFSPQTMV
ncbi:radical SAM family heme chaperone HemW [Parasphingorhabdus sp. DH2-15]|uniref:radical SAM family heme chaperone HemW n=1 Tax=Parasphingorhabdus sp. DH2-15 TaxID=3444112 RepID=UPI003F687D1E